MNLFKLIKPKRQLPKPPKWFEEVVGKNNENLPPFLKGNKTILSVDEARALHHIIDCFFEDELKNYSETDLAYREHHIFHDIAKLAPVVGYATASELKFLLTEEGCPL